MFVNNFGFDFYFDQKIILFFFLASIVGAYLRFLLVFLANQKELKNFRSFMTFVLLPPIGYLITNVISSNIALSLGMVGALSIVRFRTPVKNPLELVYYFMLITIGIVLNVEPNFALNFCIFLGIVLTIFKLINIFFDKNVLYKELFDSNSEYFFNLSVNLKNEIKTSKYKNYLKHSSFDGESYFYIYSSNKKNVIEDVLNTIESSNIISYSFDY